MRSFLLTLLVAAVCLSSCTKQTTRTVRLVVCNSNIYDVNGVVTGVSAQAVMDSLHIQDAHSIALFDEQGEPVATQLFDNGEQLLLAFECSVIAQGETTYTVRAGHTGTLPLLPEASHMHQLFEEQTVDSLRPLLDVSLLGGLINPYPALTTAPASPLTYSSAPRNPWDYTHYDILAEGTLLCAYELHYDTLFVDGDSLLEHRTLLLQKGTPLTIVRDRFENVGRRDTLLQLKQLTVALNSLSSDSLLFDERRSFLAIQRADSSATGISFPEAQSLTKLAAAGQTGFLIPYQPDSVITFFVANNSLKGDPQTFSKTLEELKKLQDPPLTTHIVIQ